MFSEDLEVMSINIFSFETKAAFKQFKMGENKYMKVILEEGWMHLLFFFFNYTNIFHRFPGLVCVTLTSILSII